MQMLTKKMPTKLTADKTTVVINKTTKQLLKNIGHKGQTYDEVICMLVSLYDNKEHN